MSTLERELFEPAGIELVLGDCTTEDDADRGGKDVDAFLDSIRVHHATAWSRRCRGWAS